MRDNGATPAVRTCQGTRKSGEPCRSRIVGADGYCNLHSPTRAIDPAEIGRRGAAASIVTRQEQAKSVRDRLRDKIEAEYADIAAAFDAGLSSDDERTRVATATALLAEAYGRPPQAIVGDPGQPVKFELVSLLARAREAIDEGEAA